MSEDLISRQAAMDAVKSAECMHIFELSEVIPKIRALPAIDAVPVVRCKHCIHSKRHCCNDVFENPLYDCEKQSFNQEHVVFHHGDWFCADGKPYCSRCGCEVEIGQDLCEKCMYEVQAEMEEHERMYEPNYHPEEGSM